MTVDGLRFCCRDRYVITTAFKSSFGDSAYVIDMNMDHPRVVLANYGETWWSRSAPSTLASLPVPERVAISASGRYIAVSYGPNRIRVYELGELLKLVDTERADPAKILFSATLQEGLERADDLSQLYGGRIQGMEFLDDTTLAVLSMSIAVIDVPTGTIKRKVACDCSLLAAAPTTPPTLVAAARGELLAWTERIEGAPQRRFPTETGLYAISMSVDGRYLAAGDSNDTVTLWRMPSMEIERRMKM